LAFHARELVNALWRRWVCAGVRTDPRRVRDGVTARCLAVSCGPSFTPRMGGVSWPLASGDAR